MAENIVDALIVTMGLDNSDYERGMNEVEDRTRQFSERAPRDVERGLSAIEQRFGATFQGIFRTFIAPLTAALSTMGIFSQYTQTADRIGKTAARIGASAEDLQAFGEAAKRAGGSVEGFISSFESLNGQIQRMQAMGGKGRLTPILKQLGISATENGKAKDTFQILRELAGASERLGKRNFAGLARNLGLDQGTIALLQQGRVAMDELIARQRALGVYTKEDFEITDKFNNAISDLQQSFRAMAAPILRVITPALTAVANWLTKIVQTFREHQGFIVAGLTVIAATMSGVLLKAATALGAALMPLLAPIAAIAGLGLIFDEIATYANGGKTAFTGLWRAIGTPEDFKAVGKAIKEAFSSGWDDLKAAAKTVAEWLLKIGENLAPLKNAVEPIKSAFNSLFSVVKNLFGLLKDAVSWVTKLFLPDDPGGSWSALKKLVDVISLAIQSLAYVAKEIFNWIDEKITAIRNWLSGNGEYKQQVKEAEAVVYKGRDKETAIAEKATELKKNNSSLTDEQALAQAKRQLAIDVMAQQTKANLGTLDGKSRNADEEYLFGLGDAPDKIAVDVPKPAAEAPIKAKDQPSPSWWNALFSSKAVPEAAAAITSRAPDAAQIQQDNSRKTTVNVKNDTVVNNRFEGMTDGNAAGLMNDAANSTQRAVERGNSFAVNNGTAAFNSGVFGS